MGQTLTLYQRLEAFDIDGDEPRLTFAGRLARENGWTIDFARRVVDEYKRFVALAMTAGHPVTPSEHIDQAWHLHLTYTESYWTRMCGQVLGRPLHHNPTRGGGDEDRKFDGWYARTLESYAAAFGQAPPQDIWPPAAQRFGHDLAWSRINTRDNLIIPRTRVRTGAFWIAMTLGAIAAAAAIGALGLRVLGPTAWVVLLAAPIGGVPCAIAGWRRAQRRTTGTVMAASMGAVGASLTGLALLLLVLLQGLDMPQAEFVAAGCICIAVLIVGLMALSGYSGSGHRRGDGGCGAGCGFFGGGCGSDGVGDGGGCGGGGCGGGCGS